MRIDLTLGTEALMLLAETGLASAWRKLFDVCPWATSYQTIDFALTWYEVYAPEWDPLLLIGKEGGRIAGILALAVAKDGRTIANVGNHQAEYQAWLSNSNDSAQFINAALSELSRHYPNGRLPFHFLPPGLEPFAITHSRRWKLLTACRSVSRPIVVFAEQTEPSKTFQKKSNRSRINRLRQQGGGELTFRELETADDLTSVIDVIAEHYDLRQGAVNNSTPFFSDPYKKRFYISLMRKGLLHAGALFAGKAMIASILSVKSADYASINILSYSPYLGKHSPGKFAVLYLTRSLREKGLRYLDITPGGDHWKDRFANTHDQVYDLTIRFNATQAHAHRLSEYTQHAVKTALATLGVTPSDARRWVSTARRIGPRSVIRHLQKALNEKRELRIYRLPATTTVDAPEDGAILRNSLAHLLQFIQTEPWLSRQQFLARALTRLERGEHVYTIAEDGLLLYYSWLCDRQKESLFNEVNARFRYPDNSAVLYGAFTYPAARGRGFHKRVCARKIVDACAVPGTEWLYGAVLADNGPSRHVIEKFGFAYQGSYFLKRILFRTIRSSTFPESWD